MQTLSPGFSFHWRIQFLGWTNLRPRCCCCKKPCCAARRLAAAAAAAALKSAVRIQLGDPMGPVAARAPKAIIAMTRRHSKTAAAAAAAAVWRVASVTAAAAVAAPAATAVVAVVRRQRGPPVVASFGPPPARAWRADIPGCLLSPRIYVAAPAVEAAVARGRGRIIAASSLFQQQVSLAMAARGSSTALIISNGSRGPSFCSLREKPYEEHIHGQLPLTMEQMLWGPPKRQWQTGGPHVEGPPQGAPG